MRLQAVCVYCGSSSRVRPTFLDLAWSVGERLAGENITLVYGGGQTGLMGKVADGAIAAGGRTVGVIPRHLKHKEVAHEGLGELIVVDSMHERKRIMVDRSDGFIVLPGGLGTLDEYFEILTWHQLRLHTKPVVLINWQGYWQPLLDMLDRATEEGFLDRRHRAVIHAADSVNTAIEVLRAEPESPAPLHTKWM